MQLTEQRSALECHGCRKRLTQTNVEVRWVSSDCQLADGLTKSDEQAAEALKRFQRAEYWGSIFVPEFVSAKKKRKQAV